MSNAIAEATPRISFGYSQFIVVSSKDIFIWFALLNNFLDSTIVHNSS